MGNNSEIEQRRHQFEKLVGPARVVIFDFDGVLADSEKYHYIAYRDVFAKYGHHIDEEEYYRYWTSLGQGARGEIERHGLNLDPVAIRREKRPVFSRYCRDGSIQLFDEARDILERFARTDKILTIASGTARSDIEAILDNAGVTGIFSEIVGSDTIPAIKPAPDVFIEILDRTGAEPYECVVFEDAEKGMQAAVTADIPVVVIRTRETRTFDFGLANLCLDSHAELSRLVASMIP